MLLADVRSGKVCTIVVWRLDRLGRTAAGLTRLFEELTQRGVNLISLQKDALHVDPGFAITDWMDACHDFADTAALIECLDLVITVDTAVVHLAGALGKPVWLLSRFDTCWRWQGNREDSPWYPTLRQFRQIKWGDWSGVMDRVVVELCDQVSLRKAA